MGTKCKNLATIYGVLGSIGTIAAAIIWGKTAKYSRYYDVEIVRNWPLTIAILLGLGLSVAMITAALYTIGETYDQVCSILYYVKNENEHSQSSQNIVPKGGWVCPKCGKAYQSYETSCRICGQFKP